MTKALLVIDMPKSCMECEILDHEVLTCMGMKVHFNNLNNRQIFCPLKPIPVRHGRGSGRHEFMNEILGEEEWKQY